MNKTEFLGLCKTALRPSRLEVLVQTAHRELYPEVLLRGAWGKSIECVYTTLHTLFTPQLQKTPFPEWYSTCEKRAVKFRKWLEEFKSGHDSSG